MLYKMPQKCCTNTIVFDLKIRDILYNNNNNNNLDKI